MPCGGIAVATARVAAENEKYLAMLDKAIIDNTITAYLANLGYKSTGYGWYVDNAYSANFQVGIYQGRVRVSNGPAGLEAQIVKLLEALAGKVRQQVIIAKLQQAGVKIQSSQIASNGSVVMEVEL